MNDCMPISLFNVIYKITPKLVVSRVYVVFDKITGPLPNYRNLCALKLTKSRFFMGKDYKGCS